MLSLCLFGVRYLLSPPQALPLHWVMHRLYKNCACERSVFMTASLHFSTSPSFTSPLLLPAACSPPLPHSLFHTNPHTHHVSTHTHPFSRCPSCPLHLLAQCPSACRRIYILGVKKKKKKNLVVGPNLKIPAKWRVVRARKKKKSRKKG